ncbi:uncharacterized protein MONBRDRAFT_7593 [Monosiga brevicollis MX1]|uniref:Uncharacterized protein n=1 Tax=Monosiga brevicollis TaxID=81824 RepID=A9UXQ6_MONBE|nr:uncharacterized protein MONBRDRAFT_7593 [Monosiga brevicollis MX1]EDQ89885.1 predicted protein [Monosiga brevicollis MX1]|eukprot:XP_001745307.1 hypothetical protein [Monosiga brevicollis MX1]
MPAPSYSNNGMGGFPDTPAQPATSASAPPPAAPEGPSAPAYMSPPPPGQYNGPSSASSAPVEEDMNPFPTVPTSHAQAYAPETTELPSVPGQEGQSDMNAAMDFDELNRRFERLKRQ